MMKRLLVPAVVLLCVVLLSQAVAEASPRRTVIGKTVSEFRLPNAYGAETSLSEYADHQLVVLAFLGTECPLAKLYGPGLQELQRRFRDDGVVVLGINSNTQDSLSELISYARQNELEFPILKDRGNHVADFVGAQRTPEVFLLDRERKIRYHGQIDDQYAVGSARGAARQQYLADAIEDLLAHREVRVAETQVIGCFIGRANNASAATTDLTYTRDIAAILHEHCVKCHREGEVAPFPLATYQDVIGWEDTILEVIQDQRMPPWFANPAHGEFANDARLNEREKSAIAEWVHGGMPEGDPGDVPELPHFTPGWRIPTPDQIIAMSDTPFRVPAQGVVDYQHFVVDPKWNEDKYIVAVQARPQNRNVTHHMLIYVIPPGKNRRDLRQVLVGYAPGTDPVRLEDGAAIFVAAGSRLLFEMHYTPNGREQSDLSDLGICFTEADKVRQVRQGGIAVNPKFAIPPNDPSYEVFAQYWSTRDEWLISLTPHMHLRGKSFRYTARYPDGTTEILLDVPRYDFNWQLRYVLKEPKRLPPYTSIECRAVYDNSADNPSNPDPSKTVRWGDQSWNEMMIGFLDTLPAKKGQPPF